MKPPMDNSSYDIKNKLTTLITFYFGNNNYYGDKFLQSKLDSNRYIAVSELPKFNKIRAIFKEHNIAD